jgi:di/tricarboxylate transporter
LFSETWNEIIVWIILALALVGFVWGRLRYDLVAMLALLGVVMFGVVSADDAFTGFSHPAVITVAAVLTLTRGLMNSGAIDLVARVLSHVGKRKTTQVGTLSSVVAGCSAFMNNVGALALLMPVAIRLARKSGHSPGILLMPIAFASLLGGKVTLIGTPPNIIISTFRAEAVGEPFRMFDYAPVGIGIALAGIVFITLIGWRLIPRRVEARSSEALFEIGEYLAEVTIPEDSKAAGIPLRELGRSMEGEVQVVALIRDERKRLAPSMFEILKPGDVLLIEADTESLKDLQDRYGLNLAPKRKVGTQDLKSEDVTITEAVIPPGSSAAGKTITQLDLRWRFSVNVLAIARQGQRLSMRIRNVKLQVGDILLLQGEEENVRDLQEAHSLLPLAGRDLTFGRKRRVGIASLIFGGALAMAALGVLPVAIAFAGAAVVMLLTRLMSLKEAYEAIELPVIVLLAAMIPVGMALEQTGGAQRVADLVLAASGSLPPWAMVAILLIATMTLSDVINNAAAAILMAPIALAVAAGVGLSSDALLMAVAVGASCAFLTPIGHQSNTLVMSPGGYKFGDYWRMGLPLEILVIVAATPLIVHFWG